MAPLFALITLNCPVLNSAPLIFPWRGERVGVGGLQVLTARANWGAEPIRDGGKTVGI